MNNCNCAEALQHSFATANDAPMGGEYHAIVAGCELVVRSEEEWMSLYRCRTCGRFWAEACYDSGHVFFYYLFPAPQSDDVVRWLREEAAELPPS